MVKESSYNWKGKKILIVEDDVASTQLLKTILSNTEAEVLLAESGEEAVELFESKESIDLVLMDIQLPQIDGYEATGKLKKLRPEIIIIAETAHAMKEDRAKSLDAGCDDYITKPIDLQELLKLINKYLA
jgi:CheY-like chemotaxis protein